MKQKSIVVFDNSEFLYVALDMSVLPSGSAKELTLVDEEVYIRVKELTNDLNLPKLLAEKDEKGYSRFYNDGITGERSFDTVVKSLCTLLPNVDKVKVSNALSMIVAELYSFKE